MGKYVTRPKMTVDEWGDADAALSLARTVIEQVREPVDTGLLNKHGLPLYRLPDERPSGFFAKWKK